MDGLAFLQESSPDESAALDWIKHYTKPSDIVLTAVGSSYDASTGWVAAITGHPTLLRWSGSHERLWRRGSPAVLAEIAAHERDIPNASQSASRRSFPESTGANDGYSFQRRVVLSIHPIILRQLSFQK